MELYERIRYLAKKKGISLAGLAKELGIPQQTFHQWLKPGSQKNIWEHLPKIIELFPDVRAAWLYIGELPPFQHDTPEQPVNMEINSPSSSLHNKVRLHPDYRDDPLGRVEMLTHIPMRNALELQAVFGVTLKELTPFVDSYGKARRAWDAWRAAGAREDDVPDVELPQIPEDWLDYFWRHYGPSTSWIVYGDGQGAGEALVKPRPGMAETERLRGELAAIKEEAQRLRDEADRLRQALADAREKNARLEATLEERTPPDKNEGNRVPSPPAANSMRPGKK